MSTDEKYVTIEYNENKGGFRFSFLYLDMLDYQYITKKTPLSKAIEFFEFINDKHSNLDKSPLSFNDMKKEFSEFVKLPENL